MPNSAHGAPPLLIGTLQGKPRRSRLVAQYADLWNCMIAFGDCALSTFQQASVPICVACEKHGRDPASLSKGATVAVNFTDGPYGILPTAVPSAGSARQIADRCAAYAEDGAEHLSTISYPWDERGLDGLAAVHRLSARLTNGWLCLRYCLLLPCHLVKSLRIPLHAKYAVAAQSRAPTLAMQRFGSCAAVATCRPGRWCGPLHWGMRRENQPDVQLSSRCRPDRAISGAQRPSVHLSAGIYSCCHQIETRAPYNAVQQAVSGPQPIGPNGWPGYEVSAPRSHASRVTGASSSVETLDGARRLGRDSGIAEERMTTANSRFTPADSAMVLIDHQVGTLQLVKNLPQERVRRFALALARAAVVLDMPIVLTSSQEERIQGPLLPEFEAICPAAYAARVRRAGIVNAWDDAGFSSAVKATGRPNLIMAGLTTDVCLVFPTISAVHEGYRVQAVLDASGSPFELSEEMARRRMADHGVVLAATNTLLAELAADWSTPHGSTLIQLLFSDILPPVHGA